MSIDNKKRTRLCWKPLLSYPFLLMNRVQEKIELSNEFENIARGWTLEQLQHFFHLTLYEF